jgi:hypothetical protein
MIVNYTDSGWQIITQRSHGLLAAQVCAHWKKDKQPARWVETLIATAEHDDVYNELQNDNLLNDKGGPVDFKDAPFRADYTERLMEMAETKSAYIALLVSAHVGFVNGDDPAAKDLISQLKTKEKSWRKTAAVNQAEIATAYKLVQFCDAFSLLVCQGQVPPEGRKVEISKGPDNQVYSLFALAEERLCIEPWPFELDSFMISYESRSLDRLEFKNLGEFRKAMKAAEAMTHQIELSRF